MVRPRYAPDMNIMIWIGAAMSVLGLLGVLWCIRKATWLKGAQIDEAQIRAEVNKLIFGHMASIGVAFMGIALLLVGMLMA